jgi:hypothetical protein
MGKCPWEAESTRHNCRRSVTKTTFVSTLCTKQTGATLLHPNGEICLMSNASDTDTPQTQITTI